MPGRNWRATNAERWIHTPKGDAQPARMNSHAFTLAESVMELQPPTDAPPHRKGPQGSHPRETAVRHLPRWPPTSGSVGCTLYNTPQRTLVPAPWDHADARRPCARPRTQFGNPKHPDREPGPILGGGQAPPFHQGDEIPAGRVLCHPEAHSESITSTGQLSYLM